VREVNIETKVARPGKHEMYFSLRLFLLMMYMLNSPLAYAREGCPAILINARPGIEKDYLMVCDGLTRAEKFFREYGINILYPIKVNLHDRGMKNHYGHIGAYDAANRRVDMLTLKQSRRLCEMLSPFDISMNESLYISFAAHEFAHAIAGQNFTYSQPSILAQEYIAYVVQIETMDKDLREKILRRYSVPAFASADEMSMLYYELNPSAFGVKSYRHFKGLDDPGGYLDKLLSGMVRPDDTQTEWF
jgi:hypothetical protein